MRLFSDLVSVLHLPWVVPTILISLVTWPVCLLLLVQHRGQPSECSAAPVAAIGMEVPHGNACPGAPRGGCPGQQSGGNTSSWCFGLGAAPLAEIRQILLLPSIVHRLFVSSECCMTGTELRNRYLT